MASFDENFYSRRLKVPEIWSCVEDASKRTRNSDCSLNFRAATASLRSLDFTTKFIPRAAPRDQKIIATRRVILSDIVYHFSSQTKTMLSSKPHSPKLPCALVVACLFFMLHLHWTSFFLKCKSRLVLQCFLDDVRGSLSTQRFWPTDGNGKWAEFILLGISVFTGRDDYFENVRETTVLASKMFAYAFHLWLKKVAYLSSLIRWTQIRPGIFVLSAGEQSFTGGHQQKTEIATANEY